MLSDFFRINLPYGIRRNDNGDWMAFNREYMPIGYNVKDFEKYPEESYLEMPIYTEFKGITDKFLMDLAGGDEGCLGRNDKGEITWVFLYSDGSNPRNQEREKQKLWDNYFDKLKRLSKLKVGLKHQNKW